MKLLNLASVVTAVALLSVSPIRAAEAAEAAKAMLKDANGQDAGSVVVHSDPRRRPAAALTEGCAAE